jgi:hypothetical protein
VERGGINRYPILGTCAGCASLGEAVASKKVVSSETTSIVFMSLPTVALRLRFVSPFTSPPRRVRMSISFVGVWVAIDQRSWAAAPGQEKREAKGQSSEQMRLLIICLAPVFCSLVLTAH